MIKRINGRSKGIRQEHFSEARIALMREVKQHPKLLENLSRVDVDWFGSQLPEIAAFVNIVVDGAFLPHELDILYDKCWQELRALRKTIILPPRADSPIVH